MSVSLSVWEIDLNYLARLYGITDSRSEEIRVALASKLSISDLDGQFALEIAAGRFPRATDALDGIMRGAYPSDASGAMYAYVCEVVVALWGRSLPGNAFAPSGIDLPMQVDAALAEMGVTAFQVSTLTSGTLPLPLPPCEDFPGFGHMTNPQCRAAWSQLQRATYRGRDEDVSAAIADVRGWLRTVTRRKSTGIVGFFS